MIKLVLCDVDNTLVPFDERPVAAVTTDAIRELRAAGVHFGLATGRDAAELERIFAGDVAAFKTGVLSNGKRVFVDGELRSLTLIEHEGFARLAEEMRTIERTMLCGYPLNNNAHNPVWCFGANEQDVANFSRDFEFEGIMLDEVPDEPIIGATIACADSQECLDQIKERFKQLVPQFDYVQPVPHWCDILPAGLNKATALDILLRELSIGLDEVVFFGDADNDVGLLQRVPNSVAVANATPAAAASARWHIGASGDHAVADALLDVAQAVRSGSLPSFMSEGSAGIA